MEIYFENRPYRCNSGRDIEKIVLVNTGDRPIQVGSYFYLEPPRATYKNPSENETTRCILLIADS